MSVSINGISLPSVSEDNNFRPDKGNLISHNESNNLILMKPKTFSKFLQRINKEVELEEELEKAGLLVDAEDVVVYDYLDNKKNNNSRSKKSSKFKLQNNG